MANESVLEEVVKRLALHFKTQVPKLKAVLEDFPEPNEKLLYPCVSITTREPQFKPLSPYEILPIENPTHHLAEVKWVVGLYDFKLQVDLWTRNKEERMDLFDLLFNALNPQIQPMGLSLRLKDYYNIWCRYSLDAHRIADDETSSQRGEFRLQVDVLANCKAIRVNKSRVMETIDLDPELLNESESIE